MAVHLLKSAGILGTSQFQVLALEWSLLLGGNLRGCAVAETRSPSVTCDLPLSLLAQGVRAGLLQFSTQSKPHFHLSVDLVWSVLLLLALLRSWVLFPLASPHGLPQRWFLSQSFCLALSVGLTAGTSRGTTRLIFWTASNGWLDEFISI